MSMRPNFRVREALSQTLTLTFATWATSVELASQTISSLVHKKRDSEGAIGVKNKNNPGL